MKYQIGDRVLIASASSRQLWNSEMDKWIGKVMTVKHITGDFYYTVDEDEGGGPKEQNGHWHWDDGMIDGYASCESSEFELSTADDLFSLMFG